MQLYRAVALASLETGLVRHRQANARMLASVPSLVDNLWESLRPYGWPSRRQAVHASPTPQLADARGREVLAGVAYAVCEVMVDAADIRVAQLPVAAACRHADVARLRHEAARIIGPLERHEGMGEDGPFAPLFRPALSAEELEDFVVSTPKARAIFQAAGDCSTFWESASQTVSPSSRGEIFFELIGRSHYTLRPLS